MLPLVASHGHGHGALSGDLGSVLVLLLLSALIALAVWAAGRATGREDIGNPAALIVFICGAVLALLSIA